MDTKKITITAVLSAFALVLMLLIRFPMFLPFLIYEPGDIPILIIAFLFGPASALGASFMLSILMAVFTGLGGPFGAFMHFLATGSFTAIAGYFYQKDHSKTGAIKGLVLGALVMTFLMAGTNLLLNPIFYGIPREQVLKMMLPGILPFNLTKAIVNSVITVLVYKKLAHFLMSKGLIKNQKLFKQSNESII
ncbi:ECF transporter S component [Halanaerobium praevalens]|uniref:Riboflavin transporter n=1 Tax=Halanaerobium praevalens (strain ATCC 33744 / DSM 2228 / GSL) TaxID=572479 RepID=E3DQY4_HALPG|nr:ECF transporter S component [Halanaerobium praevalens]ADO76959.1 membrane protein [Halanaerobium praevalens DSM 2228]